MPQGAGFEVEQIVRNQEGLRRKWDQQGVSTSATFPPRTLEPNQAHGSPNNTVPPFPPPP